MDPELEQDTSYCGVGIQVEETPNGLIIIAISPDSDLAKAPLIEGLESIKVGDMITSITEHGFTRAVGTGSGLRGPAGTIVSLRFVPEEEIGNNFVLERTIFAVTRKPFTGGYDNRLNVDGPSCISAYVEADPAELMQFSPSVPQFASLSAEACYKG